MQSELRAKKPTAKEKSRENEGKGKKRPKRRKFVGSLSQGPSWDPGKTP